MAKKTKPTAQEEAKLSSKPSAPGKTQQGKKKKEAPAAKTGTPKSPTKPAPVAKKTVRKENPQKAPEQKSPDESLRGLFDVGENGITSDFLATANFIKAEGRNVQIHYLVPKSEKSEMILVSKVDHIMLQNFQVSANLYESAEREMRKNFGINLDKHMANVLRNEMLWNLEKTLFTKYLDYAPTFSLTPLQEFWQKIRPNAYKHKTVKNIADLEKELEKMRRGILCSSRLGAPTFIVVGHEINSVLSDSPYYSPYFDEINQYHSCVKMAGSWKGLNVFVNPYIKDQVLMGTRVKETGAFYVHRDDSFLKEETRLQMITECAFHITHPEILFKHNIRWDSKSLWQKAKNYIFGLLK